LAYQSQKTLPGEREVQGERGPPSINVQAYSGGKGGPEKQAKERSRIQRRYNETLVVERQVTKRHDEGEDKQKTRLSAERKREQKFPAIKNEMGKIQKRVTSDEKKKIGGGAGGRVSQRRGSLAINETGGEIRTKTQTP